MWSRVRLVKAAALTATPSTRCWSRPWEEASNTTWLMPARSMPPRFDRKVSTSGVVMPRSRLPMAVMTPSVPRLAAGRLSRVQIWRSRSATEVLPLVPVTAAMVAGMGAYHRAAISAKRWRGFAATMCTARAVSTFASGRATMATAPAAMASSMKSSPLKRTPGKAPKMVPGVTLR